tara:strand:+ start:56 stop:841 length:786 start_codon:yes stop_codon:yes gene_type:complete
MNETQLNYFKTYSTGLIDSVLIKTEAKGYVIPCGVGYTKDDLNCDWKWANNPQTGENYDLEKSEKSYDRVRRNNGGNEVSRNQGYTTERARVDGRKTTPIDIFLRTWLDTKDDTIFNTIPGEDPIIDYGKEYPLPFKNKKDIIALLLFKWVSMKCKINQGQVQITADDIKNIGINITLVDLSILLKSYFDRSLIRNWYDQESKTLELKVGGREQKNGKGAGYITFDMGPNQLQFIEALTNNLNDEIIAQANVEETNSNNRV